MTLCPRLPLASYRLEFRCAPGRNLRFPGSAWRGALGHTLRELACLTGERDCSGCTSAQRCAYAYLFDTPVPPDAVKMRRYEQVPHPFALREAQPAPGQVHLHLTLFGRANAHLPVMVLALARAAAGGQGIAGRQMSLREVAQRDGSGIWQRIDRPGGALAPQPPMVPAVPEPPAGAIHIECRSPLRVKREGRPVRPRDFSFADLFGNLLRRVSMLTAFHTDSSFETDFRALMEAARAVRATTDLRWIDLPRHSARQRADMVLGGVVGSLQVDAADLAPFWPILWLGQYTHAGAAATMGLGHYRIESASLPQPAGDKHVDDTFSTF
jgi:hypothetical protein